MTSSRPGRALPITAIVAGFLLGLTGLGTLVIGGAMLVQSSSDGVGIGKAELDSDAAMLASAPLDWSSEARA